jgi:DNA-binding CsgD family transcriptional regulator/DNA-binding transcriptional MerR regulator
LSSVEQPGTDDKYFQMDGCGIDEELASCLVFIDNFDVSQPDCIGSILTFAIKHLHARAVQFGCLDYEHKALHIREQCHQGNYGSPRISLLNQAISLNAFVTEKWPIAVCQDLQASPFWAAIPEFHGCGLRSYLGSSVKLNGNLYGSLMAFDSRPRLFSASQVIAIKLLAMMIAFVEAYQKAGDELSKYRRQLETLVQSRTAELARTNALLREEIERRAEATEKLRASSDSLKEMNTAMRVLLNKRTEDYQRAEEIIRVNLKELIDPYVERLENSGMNRSQKQLLNVIRMNLDEVAGSTTLEFSSKYYILSPNEVQVVNLIRKGKTSKEMSRLLNVSVRTIEAYRNSIRKKFNLKNKKINLRTYLSSV